MEVMVPDRLKNLVALDGETAEPEAPPKASSAEILMGFIY